MGSFVVGLPAGCIYEERGIGPLNRSKDLENPYCVYAFQGIVAPGQPLCAVAIWEQRVNVGTKSTSNTFRDERAAAAFAYSGFRAGNAYRTGFIATRLYHQGLL
ncbi:MAG: hypothetical protein ACREV3_03745 [Gammaproteobacteria bacterium]